MDIRWIAIAAALPLAACSSSEAPVESTPAVPPAEAACNADAVQSLIGQTATADVGGQLLNGSGARTLRWVPPPTAVTIVFSPHSLTVSSVAGTRRAAGGEDGSP